MTWREAFFLQARSENEIRKLLNRAKAEYAHQLHYLQMASEKLAKAYATTPGSLEPPTLTHTGLVRLLRLLKSMPRIRRELGYVHTEAFRAFIDSLIPVAARIERLAPSLASIHEPNPEYPWQDRQTQEIFVPAAFNFPDFKPTSPLMLKFERLLEAMFRIGV
jgi:hypothetical protein